MSYREITVCLHKIEDAEPLALMACRVGAGLHAHVNGVHGIPEYTLDTTLRSFVPENVVEQFGDRVKEISADIEKDFKSTMSQSDTSWQYFARKCQNASDFKPYIEFALYSDLVIAAQPPNAVDEIELHRTLLLKAGTPLLMVPAEPDKTTFADRIMVAWNATPESARAVRDAMPLLSNAEEVHLVNVGAKGEHFKSDKGGASAMNQPNLDQYLERHNVTSTHHQLTDKKHGISENLFEHARQYNMDLLVMGGFGHSRLYDVFVGAATGELIKTAKLPLFLSH